MPARLPKLSLHKATGKARVVIDGRHHYLGEFGSAEAKAAYAKLIDKWLLRQKSRFNANLSIGELILLYDSHVADYYRKAGKATSEIHVIKAALKPLAASYAHTPAVEFGPRDLKARWSVTTTTCTTRKAQRHMQRLSLEEASDDESE